MSLNVFTTIIFFTPLLLNDGTHSVVSCTGTLGIKGGEIAEGKCIES